jgi:uncharacterized protein YbbK (DUF523 family)
MTEPRPVIVVSRCLLSERCRYDGEVVTSEIVRKLKPVVKFIPACPEMEIGLGVPRESIRIVSERGTLRLIQSTTGRDLTRRMNSYCRRFLASLPGVDGFILKSRSPSCGLKDVRVFNPSSGTRRPGTAVNGFFADAVLTRFPQLAVESERGLMNTRRRRRFLARVFSRKGRKYEL